MMTYRILERRTDGAWMPFGVAFTRGEQAMLFVPAWRAPRPLAHPLGALGTEDYPSQAFTYRWGEVQTAPAAVTHPIDLLPRAMPPRMVDEFLKVVGRALFGGEQWRLLPQAELGEGEEPGEGSPLAKRDVLVLSEGPLEGAEVEITPGDRLVVALNRAISPGSRLELLAATGEVLALPVVHMLDRQGRAIYDLSGVAETPAFRLVLMIGGEDGDGEPG